MFGYERRRYPGPWAVAALVGANACLALAVESGRKSSVGLALIPVLAVAVAALVASNRAVLILAAFALNLVTLSLTVLRPIDLGLQVYPSDVIVLLAVASWIAAWLVSPREMRPSLPRTHVLGWPLLLFGIALFAAIVRGHDRYGAQLIGVPARLLIYAGIAAALTDVTARVVYRWLVILFYAGAVWQTILAVHGYATGTSVTDQTILSTGGERVLAGSTAMFMTGTLLFALLNLERDQSARNSILHLAMAALAIFSLASTFQRTTFVAAGVLVPLIVLVFRRIATRTLAFLPLCAPFVALAVIFVSSADPGLFRTLLDRITASPSTDASAQWRLRAYEAVWGQVRESPITGVGFGGPVSFISNGVHYTVGQDPHNQYLYLWAGGGVLLFGSLMLLFAVYLFESWRRFRTGTPVERRLIFWAVSLWFVFAVNTGTGIVLTEPSLLLSFWILMLLPMIVPLRRRSNAAFE